MASLNPLTREVVFKVVFYGPGLGGKTTTLQYIHAATKPEHRGKMVSLATPMDRTLYFDFLPLRVPRVRGMSVRLQLFTVPGQVYYGATRKLVLTGADGVVFVADSQVGREDANQESLEDLVTNLADHNRALVTVPHTFHWNKRDLSDVVAIEEMERKFNPQGAPSLGTVATRGAGVFEGLERIMRLVMRAYEAELPAGSGRESAVGAPRDSEEAGIADAIRGLAESPYKPKHTPFAGMRAARPDGAPSSLEAIPAPIRRRLQSAPDLSHAAPPSPVPGKPPSSPIPGKPSSSPVPGHPPSSPARSGSKPFIEEGAPSAMAASAAAATLPEGRRGSHEPALKVSPERPAPSPAASPPAREVAQVVAAAPAVDGVVERQPPPLPVPAVPIPPHSDSTELAHPRIEQAPAIAMPPAGAALPVTAPPPPDMFTSFAASRPESRMSLVEEPAAAEREAAQGISFAELWSDAEREGARDVERAIASRDVARAAVALDLLLTRVLASAAGLAGTADAPRDPAMVPLFLGLDGRRYLAFRALVRGARMGEEVPMRAVLDAYAFAIEARRARESIR